MSDAISISMQSNSMPNNLITINLSNHTNTIISPEIKHHTNTITSPRGPTNHNGCPKGNSRAGGAPRQPSNLYEWPKHAIIYPYGCPKGNSRAGGAPRQPSNLYQSINSVGVQTFGQNIVRHVNFRLQNQNRNR